MLVVVAAKETSAASQLTVGQVLVAIKSLLWIPCLIFKQNTLLQIKGVITVQN